MGIVLVMCIFFLRTKALSTATYDPLLLSPPYSEVFKFNSDCLYISTGPRPKNYKLPKLDEMYNLKLDKLNEMKFEQHLTTSSLVKKNVLNQHLYTSDNLWDAKTQEILNETEIVRYKKNFNNIAR